MPLVALSTRTSIAAMLRESVRGWQTRLRNTGLARDAMNTADDESNTSYPGKKVAVGLDIDQTQCW